MKSAAVHRYIIILCAASSKKIQKNFKGLKAKKIPVDGQEFQRFPSQKNLSIRRWVPSFRSLKVWHLRRHEFQRFPSQKNLSIRRWVPSQKNGHWGQQPQKRQLMPELGLVGRQKKETTTYSFRSLKVRPTWTWTDTWLFIQISLALVAKKRKLLHTALDHWKWGQRERERGQYMALHSNFDLLWLLRNRNYYVQL